MVFLGMILPENRYPLFGIMPVSRSERLLDLIQTLRRHRHPVAAQTLADELGVSLRTVYRDVATLQHQGASIDGEPGVGYVLRPGFMLPPLMFSEQEIEAIVLGSRWVARRGDKALAEAARNALAKIAAVLPEDLTDHLDAGLLVGPGDEIAAGDAELATIRQAIRETMRLIVTYRDDKGEETKRTIWPIALAFFDRVRVVVAWCEMRTAFRHFRVDRIRALTLSKRRIPRSRAALLKEWREIERIPKQ
jgi:predicted DNA-binding transcriptional regulator YafY